MFIFIKKKKCLNKNWERFLNIKHWTFFLLYPIYFAFLITIKYHACWTHFIGIISLCMYVCWFCLSFCLLLFLFFWYYLSQTSVTDIRIRSNDLLFCSRSILTQQQCKFHLWLHLILFLCSLLFTCYLSRCLHNKSKIWKEIINHSITNFLIDFSLCCSHEMCDLEINVGKI